MAAARLSVAIWALAGLVVLTSVPLWANPGWTYVAGLILVEGLFCLSWNLLFGFSGIATFGHAAFFALGAYLVGWGLKGGAPFLLLLGGAALLGAIASALVGFVALRRMSGLHLAVLTLALSEVLFIVTGNIHALGGVDGMGSIPRPVIHLGLVEVSLRDSRAYFWFLLLICAALAFAMWWLVHSRFGRVLRCIKQDAERAAFIGVNVARYRLAAFVVAGAIAAVAGGLSAPWTQIVTPAAGHWVHSIQAVLNSLLGGVGFFWGPLLGTAIFAGIDLLTRTFAGLSEIVVGGILLMIVLAFPGGVLGFLAAQRSRRQQRNAARAGVPASMVAKEPAE
ncbi:MAG TPA: branched-chain amino acid ABC transporter permease [Paracoccus sp. (in: a-proteobacteria)]|uniref:branched-chain amino acid ABC transporter permease n=1 Tax=Paracoccus sp. TaxID=267 RepID=UPI002C0CA821|nr:branched-chain amino acid ABC transporter permease [Paracoccus sp. (in: a-proteobacteria)]HWL57589.1 branched-chain amino acid ABC transporter permease [Paracoccus sp. (in: a-proteobacteria)]